MNRWTRWQPGWRFSDCSPRTSAPTRLTSWFSTPPPRPWWGGSSARVGSSATPPRSSVTASSHWRFASSWTSGSWSTGSCPGDSLVVDRDLILRKLADLDQYLAQVAEYRGITVDEYRRDWKVQRIVERTLQVGIGEGGDGGTHVLAD